MNKKGEIETIIDPTMGTGGFLTMSVKYLNEKYKNKIDWTQNKNRIYGLVSYYGDMYTNTIESIKESIKNIKSKENYPDRLPIKIEIIEMSNVQNAEYNKARDIEKKENKEVNVIDFGLLDFTTCQLCKVCSQPIIGINMDECEPLYCCKGHAIEFKQVKSKKKWFRLFTP